MNIDALTYQRMAEAHRPTDVTAAVRELADRGLSERDIGQALRLDPSAVRAMLTASGDEAAKLHADAWRA